MRLAMAVGTFVWVAGLGLEMSARAGAPAAPDGAVLYARHCAQCHGPTGRGDGVDADLFDPPPRDLRSGPLAAYDRAALVARVRDGVPLSLALDPAALARRADTVEDLVAHIRRLPTLDWRAIEAGQETWVVECEACHGAFGQPPAVLPPGVSRPPDLSTSRSGRALDAPALADRIRHGHARMPALVGDDLAKHADGLVAFVALFSPGYRSWSRYCASCHGDDGRGPGELWATTKRPTVAFDARWLAGRDAEQLRTATWHMLADEEPQMPHFPRLRSEEAAAIVDWLRAERTATP